MREFESKENRFEDVGTRANFLKGFNDLNCSDRFVQKDQAAKMREAT